MKYTKERLEEAAKKSISVTGVMRHLGIKYISGGLHSYLSKKLKEFKIDTTHFTGQGHNKNKKALNKLTPKEIFTYDRNNGRREKTEILRRSMIESGVFENCKECGQDTIWNKQKLILQVDHINGDPLDNREDNLRFLCPNCHSQTKNFCKKKDKNEKDIP